MYVDSILYRNQYMSCFRILLSYLDDQSLVQLGWPWRRIFEDSEAYAVIRSEQVKWTMTWLWMFSCYSLAQWPSERRSQALFKQSVRPICKEIVTTQIKILASVLDSKF